MIVVGLNIDLTHLVIIILGLIITIDSFLFHEILNFALLDLFIRFKIQKIKSVNKKRNVKKNNCEY